MRRLQPDRGAASETLIDAAILPFAARARVERMHPRNPPLRLADVAAEESSALKSRLPSRLF